MVSAADPRVALSYLTIEYGWALRTIDQSLEHGLGCIAVRAPVLALRILSTREDTNHTPTGFDLLKLGDQVERLLKISNHNSLLNNLI